MIVVEVYVCRERWVNVCYRFLVNELILCVFNLIDLFIMYILLLSDCFLFYCLFILFCLFYIKEFDENIWLFSIYGYKV